MSIPEDAEGAAALLDTADTAARSIRARRRWYAAGAIVMAIALIAFTVALAAWPERLAEVIVPGLVVIAALLGFLAWRGRTVPAASTALTNRVMAISVVALVVALLLIRLVVPEGITVWAGLVGLLPGLPFGYLAWRVGRA